MTKNRIKAALEVLSTHESVLMGFTPRHLDGEDTIEGLLAILRGLFFDALRSNASDQELDCLNKAMAVVKRSRVGISPSVLNDTYSEYDLSWVSKELSSKYGK